MDYQAAVNYLLSLGRELAAPTQAAAAKFDLENISILGERLGRPDRAYPSAHIAGTNGKGSTAAFLDAILRRAGFRTGLYTSPHLERINERIRISGQEIGDEAFAETFTRVQALIEELLAAGELRAHPTFFECVTAMAFEAFARARVEFGIFEVGLGGRLDATNLITPTVSLLTPIEFDHESFLGHSLPEIASEKAGILKPGVQAICAAQPPEAQKVLARRAAELRTPLLEIDGYYRIEEFSLVDGRARAKVQEEATGWRIEIAPNLAGRFQLQNALTAIAAARYLATRGYRIPNHAIRHGIASTEWPGRLEKLSEHPDVYLDGAHNPAAARELAAFWEQCFAGRKIWLVYGALRDKAVDEIAGAIFPRASEVILTEAHTSRAISARQLADIAGHHAARFAVVPDAEGALERALGEAAPNDAVFVTGSLYLVGQVRHLWKNRVRAAAK